MCYNCGCGIPDDDHGNPKNITNKTFRDAAKASEQTIKDAKTKTNTLLTTVLSTKAGTKDKKKKLK